MTLLDYVDLFAGPGGWEARLRGLSGVGIENNPAACQTRRAAGLPTIESDVRALGPTAVPARRMIGSPVCTPYSQANRHASGGHENDLDPILDAVHRWGRNGRPDDVSASIDEIPALVLEPLRWILTTTRPYDSIALEQVRSVRPVWEAYADVLRGRGYAVEVVTLNAADYGVPQTRVRSFLLASRRAEVDVPLPTHVDPSTRSEDEGLFPDPRPDWITFAGALSWDEATVRSRIRERRYAPKIAGGLDPYSWPLYRPATTVASGNGPRNPPPSYRLPGQGAFTGTGVVEITVEEAGVLQSFPRSFPWQGTSGERFSQIGNAVPPLLAGRLVEALP